MTSKMLALLTIGLISTGLRLLCFASTYLPIVEDFCAICYIDENFALTMAALKFIGILGGDLGENFNSSRGRLLLKADVLFIALACLMGCGIISLLENSCMVLCMGDWRLRP